jgi:transposase
VCRTRLARVYSYVFAAVDPLSGVVFSLILPRANMETMELFLRRLGRRFRGESVLVIMDRAAWHTSRRLRVPSNVRLDFLPSYSPQLNPVEPVWKEVRQDYFTNALFSGLDEVDATLCTALKELNTSHERVKSFAGFEWIITSLTFAN